MVQRRNGRLFPFNKFSVAEANAPAAERAYVENNRRDNQNAYVTVRVRRGDAALDQLYIDNEPLSGLFPRAFVAVSRIVLVIVDSRKTS